MISAYFKDAERELLLSKVSEWNDLKGTGRQRNEDGDLVNLKDDFIDDLVGEFFARFPGRDIFHSPDSPDAIMQTERDRLPTRMRQFLYNNARHDTEKESKATSNPYKSLSVLTLFKQRYSKDILQRRDKIIAEGNVEGALRAYNTAAVELLARLEKDVPAKHKQLQQEVEQLRQASHASYQSHSEDVQSSILSMFPTEVVKTVREWERRTGAAIYVITAFQKPDTGPEVFDISSIDIPLGAHLTNNPDLAIPSIYPDRDGRPMLPQLPILKVGMDEEKRIMRRYFTGVSLTEFMGGVPPPYAALEACMRIDPGSIIERRRMPPGFPVLRDPEWWSRKELNSWITHILKGQKAHADNSVRFQWHRVPVHEEAAPIVVRAFQARSHPESTLKYTQNELLYTRKVQSEVDKEDASIEDSASWRGLPVARTVHVYTVYRQALAQHLLSIHEPHKEMTELIKSVARMEQYGPVHPFSTLITMRQRSGLCRRFVTGYFSHVHIFMLKVELSLEGLMTLDRIRERKDIPRNLNTAIFSARDLVLSTNAAHNSFMHTRAKPAVLQITFPERAQAFEREVQRRAERTTFHPFDSQPQAMSNELGLSNGVPLNETRALALWAALQARQHMLPDIDASLDASRVVTLQRRRPTKPAAPMSPIIDDSHEEISLPRDSEISGTSGEEGIKLHILKKDRGTKATEKANAMSTQVSTGKVPEPGRSPHFYQKMQVVLPGRVAGATVPKQPKAQTRDRISDDEPHETEAVVEFRTGTEGDTEVRSCLIVDLVLGHTMARQFFTDGENEWLGTLGGDLKEWRESNKGKSPNAFFTQTVKGFLERFPYRHPRTTVRHRFNNLSGTKKGAKGAKIPVNREITDALADAESQFDTMRRVNHEGFWLVKRGTPYSIDESAEAHNYSVVNRMDAYHGIDYACCTNQQREEALKDLPEDLDDIVQFLARRTGGEFYIIGTWKDFHRGFVTHQSTTDRIWALIDPEVEGNEVFPNRFVDYIRKNIGERLETDVSRAQPCAFGSFDVWQGGQLPVPWPVECPGKSDKGYMDIDPARLPGGIRGLAHPDWYDEEITWKWAKWIIRGQNGGLGRAHIFQFRRIDDAHVETSFREEIHPGSRLRYGPETRLFVACMLAVDDGDALARAELKAQVPEIQSKRAYVPFTPTDQQDIRNRCVGSEALLSLLTMVASSGAWLAMKASCPHLIGGRPDPLAGIASLGSWWLPAAVFSPDRSISERLTMPALRNWLNSGVLHHRATRTLMGGPYGIKWAFLLLARAYWSHMAILAGLRPEYPVRSLSVEDTSILIQCSHWLCEQITQSVSLLLWIRGATTSLELAYVPSREDFKRADYWIHRSTVEASASDASSIVPAEPSPRRPRRRPRQVPKGQVRFNKRVKNRLYVLMPTPSSGAQTRARSLAQLSAVNQDWDSTLPDKREDDDWTSFDDENYQPASSDVLMHGESSDSGGDIGMQCLVDEEEIAALADEAAAADASALDAEEQRQMRYAMELSLEDTHQSANWQEQDATPGASGSGSNVFSQQEDAIQTICRLPALSRASALVNSPVATCCFGPPSLNIKKASPTISAETHSYDLDAAEDACNELIAVIRNRRCGAPVEEHRFQGRIPAIYLPIAHMMNTEANAASAFTFMWPSGSSSLLFVRTESQKLRDSLGNSARTLIQSTYGECYQQHFQDALSASIWPELPHPDPTEMDDVRPTQAVMAQTMSRIYYDFI
ncbi:hypothetical protein BDV93DRAFT_515921 [Ceratobasidium sp. AG-I]|nr:hypothetical protein BDV93DRAFT_515921 [Ceratobasidium sp. AG-I]